MTDSTGGDGTTTAAVPSGVSSPPADTGTATAVAPSPSGDGSSASKKDDTPPKLADGVELIGEYEDSGLEDAPSIARLSNGQMVQLPEILYVVAEQLDGSRSYDQIAAVAGEKLGRELGPGDIRTLVDEKLAPLGLIGSGASGAATQQPERVDPLLALKLRKGVVPAWFVRGATTVLRPLFFPPVLVAVVAAFVAFDVWLFGVHGIAQSMRDLLNEPALALLVFALVIVSVAFHEFGHATACRYGGAEPGEMGAGIYIVWPAFYTDVTDAYRLGKWARVRTDMGGIYFNVIFTLAVAGVYLATGYEPLLVVVLVQHLQMFQQFLPFLRLDGYYVVADLTGVPDLFSRIKPILLSLIPGRKPDPKVTELKRSSRAIVTAWVLLAVPFLAYVYVLMVLHLPRLIATGLESFSKQSGSFSSAMSAGDWPRAGLGALHLAFLVLPAAGIAFTLARSGTRAGKALWTATEGRPVGRTALAVGSAAVVAFAAFALWPDDTYQPIRPGERGTLQDATRAVAKLPSEGRHAAAPEPSATPSETPSPTHSPSPSPTSTPRSRTGSGTTSSTPSPTRTPAPVDTPAPAHTPAPVDTPAP